MSLNIMLLTALMSVNFGVMIYHMLKGNAAKCVV